MVCAYNPRVLNIPTVAKMTCLQYIPRNMHTVFALLCFVVVIHWLIFPYPPDLLRWHCGNLTIAPVPTKQPWWIWINTSCEIIMNDYITTTKQSTTKPCAYLLGYTVSGHVNKSSKQCTHCVGCLHVMLIIQAYYKKWLSRSYCQRDSAGEVMGKHSYVQSMSF